jgi:hypothetical protein
MDDKRVSKMTLETAQMYCTVTSEGPYRPTHADHPLMAWAKNDLSWLIRFHQALASEHYYRTGNIHKSFRDVGQFMQQLPDVEPRSFMNCARTSKLSMNPSNKTLTVPMDFRNIQDPHYAYRLYLRARWYMDARPAVWTRRPPPMWLDEGVDFGVDRSLPLFINQSSVVPVAEDRWECIVCYARRKP